MTDSDLSHLLLLTTTWIGYFALHSVLASLAFKRLVAARRPEWVPALRLGFNAIAVLALIPPLWLTYADRGPWLWQWTGVGWWIANALALLALAGFVWSLRWYDGLEFVGIAQWRRDSRQVEDQEAFRLSPLHRFVRHPWYALSLVLIWTRDMDWSLLLTALLLTGYLVVGSRLEERKLLVYHGDRYRRYREAVPALLPSARRRLTPAQARALVQGRASIREAEGRSG